MSRRRGSGAGVIELGYCNPDLTEKEKASWSTGGLRPVLLTLRPVLVTRDCSSGYIEAAVVPDDGVNNEAVAFLMHVALATGSAQVETSSASHGLVPPAAPSATVGEQVGRNFTGGGAGIGSQSDLLELQRSLEANYGRFRI